MAGIEPPSPSPALPSPELGRMTSMAAGRKGPPRLSGFFNVVSPRLCHPPGPSLPVARLSQSSTANLFFLEGGVRRLQGLARLHRVGLQGTKTLICCRAPRQDTRLSPPTTTGSPSTVSRQDAGRMDKTAGPLSFNLETC